MRLPHQNGLEAPQGTSMCYRGSVSVDHEVLRLWERGRVAPIRAVLLPAWVPKGWLHPCPNTVANFYQSTKPQKMHIAVVAPP